MPDSVSLSHDAENSRRHDPGRTSSASSARVAADSGHAVRWDDEAEGMSARSSSLPAVALQGSGIQAPSAASMWQDALSTPLSGFSFVEVARHTGLLLFVAVRDNHEPYVSNVTVQTADTTLLNRSDNGNAVAVHLTLHASEFSFVNSALTPGQGQGAHALSLHEAALLLTTGICAQLP